MTAPDYPITDWMPLIGYGSVSSNINQHIIINLISHPTELLTEVELNFMMTATGERTAEDVQIQLNELCDAGLVTRYDKDTYTFYGLTDAGKQFIVDSHHYRAHEVWKDIYQNIERTDEVITAYEAERPAHSPSEADYEEREYGESDAWDAAHEATFRTIVLSLERTGDSTFSACLVELDENQELASMDIEVEAVGKGLSNSREMEFIEPRGRIVTNEQYGIEVTREGTTYKIQPAKNSEGWYEMIERSLYIFTE